MELSRIDRSEMVQSIPRGVDKSMLSSGPSLVSAFSQCYPVSLRCLLTLCVERTCVPWSHVAHAGGATNGDGLCGTPRQMVAPEFKLTKKVTVEREVVGSPVPRVVVEGAPEVEPRRFHLLFADIQTHGHTGSCPGCVALASHA